ncbi:hypothetical protein BOQ64_16690 [Chryseobacterium sp. CH25]|nr:hypothetical protein BOQ64_16690 [Chryseobacterium sp. CH25]
MFLLGICVFFKPPPQIFDLPPLQKRGIITLSTGYLPSLKILLTVILNGVKRNEESQNNKCQIFNISQLLNFQQSLAALQHTDCLQNQLKH